MKKLRLSLFVLGICLSIPGFARINIVLKGSWNRVEKSIDSNIPFQIWLEDNNKDLTVHFSENVGLVEVCIITSDKIVVHNAVLNTAKMSTHLIMLNDGLVDAEYQIIVSNERGAVSGVFSLKSK